MSALPTIRELNRLFSKGRKKEGFSPCLGNYSVNPEDSCWQGTGAKARDSNCHGRHDQGRAATR